MWHIGSGDIDAPKVSRLSEPPYRCKPLTSSKAIPSLRARGRVARADWLRDQFARRSRARRISSSRSRRTTRTSSSRSRRTTMLDVAQVGAEERTRDRGSWSTLLSDSTTLCTFLIALILATRSRRAGRIVDGGSITPLDSCAKGPLLHGSPRQCLWPRCSALHGVSSLGGQWTARISLSAPVHRRAEAMPLAPILITRSRECSLRGPWHHTGTEHRKIHPLPLRTSGPRGTPRAVSIGAGAYPPYGAAGIWTAVQDEPLYSHDSGYRHFRDPAEKQAPAFGLCHSNRARGAKSPATAQAGLTHDGPSGAN